jgi:pimeloyl-ACP methyl ester carboxylesterase
VGRPPTTGGSRVGELAYERRGSGEPIVLLHGLGSRRKAFRPVIDRLAGERELIAVDLPGFGESRPDPAGTKLTVADHAERIERFCEELDLERPHLAGNSMGGAIALELGRRGAARSITVFSPIGFWGKAGQAWCRNYLRAGFRLGQRMPEPPSPAVDLFLTRLSVFVSSFGKPFKAPAEEVLGTRDDALAAPGFLDALDFGLDYTFREPAELGAVPITVAWGRRDLLLPYWTQAPRARRNLPLARHLALTGCGHIPFYDDPELCSGVLRAGTGG